MGKSKDNKTSKQTAQQGGKREQQSIQQSQTAGRQQTALSRRDQFAPTLWASPFTFIRQFREEMDRLIEDFGSGRAIMPRAFGELAAWAPQVDVFERDGQLVVRADLPGMNKDDVQLEITDEAIILRGERRQEREEEREGAYVSEVSYGSFYREIPLPQGSNADNAKATFRDGVLEITVPAPERESRRRQLEIKDESQTGEQAQARAKAAGVKV